MRRRLAITFAFAITLLPALGQDDGGDAFPTYFYRDVSYGSQSQFNPISSFLNYAFDSLQIHRSFDLDDFSEQTDETWDNLRDPFGAIDEAGSTKRFINTQIFPVDFSNLGDSIEMLPNYGLHLLGGGMVYRKNAEWFQAHRYPYPRILAASLSMGAEFLQEVVEKKSTASDDEIADFYIFRPAGMLLFTWDPFAEFAANTLRLVEWPYQPMVQFTEPDLQNVGENFVARPALFGERHRPFIYFGLNTMLGLSHRVSSEDHLSWGFGAAVVDADPDDLEIRASGGLFWDRKDSLMASAIFNGTEDLAVRLNLYPGAVMDSPWFPGVFLGIHDHGDISLGLTLRLTPAGLSHRF